MRKHFANLGKLVGVAVPLVAAVAAGKLVQPYLPAFTDWVATLGVWGPLAFIGVYVVAVILCMPAFLLTIASGAIFGVTRGSIYVMVGALLGGLCAFLVARYLIRDFVVRKMSSNPKLVAIDRAVGEDGRRIVFFLRLSPVVPFVLSNYALGVTRVHLLDYVLGTIGLLPIVVSYAAMGKASGATNAAGKSALSMPVLAVGVIATVLLAWLMTRIAQKAIAEAEGTSPSAAETH